MCIFNVSNLHCWAFSLPLDFCKCISIAVLSGQGLPAVELEGCAVCSDQSDISLPAAPPITA